MSKFQKMAKKATSILVSLTTTVWLAGVGTLVPFAVQADATTDALNAQIQSLLAQIAQLQAQLAGIGGSSSTGKCAFTKDLQMGSRGDDVKCLQSYLTSTGHYTYSGGATGYFGSITKAAVAAWQAANAVSPAAGYFGPKSRAKYDMVVVVTPPPATKMQCEDGTDNDSDTKIDYPNDPDCSSASDNTEAAAATGTGLTVGTATQPAATLAVENSIHLPYTSFTLTASADGDVKVDSITVERTGLANDAVFSGVVLLDENMMPVTAVAKSLNSNHQTVLTDDFTVPAGKTKTFHLTGNMASSLDSYAGQVAYLSLVAVNTVGASVTGSMPITGAGHTVNGTLAIGSVTLAKGPLDPGNVGPTKEVGTTGYTFTSLKATAGSNEDVVWKSIRFNQSGSASKTDLANVKIYDSAGTAYTTEVSSDGKYYWTNFGGTGLPIKKGESKEVYIKADIASGSARTVDFDLYRYDDAVFHGSTYNYDIQPSGTSEGSGTHSDDAAFYTTEPRYDADEVTIGSGSLRVEKSNTAPAANIANGDDAAVLGAFTFEAKGEPISFTSWVLTISTTNNDSDATSGALTNVTIYDKNGAAVAGPKDFTKTSITFSDTVTVPVGTNTYTVKGNLDNNWENNDTIQVSFTPSSALTTVKGVDTGTTVTPTPSSSVAANTQTVKAGQLVISPSSTLSAQTYVEGANDVELGRFTLDGSGSGEDLKVTVVKIHSNMDTAPTTDVNHFASFRLFDGTTQLNTGSNVLEAAATANATDLTLSITLDAPGLVIPKGSSKTLALKANLTTSFDEGDVSQFDFVGLTDGDWSVTGVSTGAEITEDLDVTTTGSTMTIKGQGGWSVAAAPSVPSEKWVVAGQTGVTLNVLRLTSTTEEFALTDLRLQIDTTGSSTAGDFAKVSLWDGNTKLIEKIPSFTNGVEDFVLPSSGTGSFIVPKDSYKDLTIKADLAGIGNSLSGTAGELVGVDYDGATSSKNVALGKASGQRLHSSTASDQTGNGVVMFRSVPTVERLPLPVTALTSGNHVLYKFQVKADPAYDIAVHQFTFNVSTTGITSFGSSVPSFTLRNVTDGNKRVSAATGAAAEFFTDMARYSNTTGTLRFHITADTTDYSSAWVTIPAGQTHVFELRGDITTDGSADSVSTYLVGNNARPNRVTLTGGSRLPMLKVSRVKMDTSVGPNEADQAATASTTAFIWTDFSSDATTSHSVNTADWMNGYKVPGLLSTGLDPSTLSTGSN